jgi:outer membrane lipoprotein SlyB
MKKIIAIIPIFLGLGIMGCASDISSNSYNASQVNHAARTVPATIVSMRQVEINNSSGAGGLVGAAAGATAGYEYTLRTEYNQLVTITQVDNYHFQPNQKVLILYERNSAKIVPDTTGDQTQVANNNTATTNQVHNG